MTDLGDILEWLRYRKVKKNRKITEDALMHLNNLTVTYHGRIMLAAVCMDPDNELPTEIRRMYWVLLQSAPVKEFAQWN